MGWGEGGGRKRWGGGCRTPRGDLQRRTTCAGRPSCPPPTSPARPQTPAQPRGGRVRAVVPFGDVVRGRCVRHCACGARDTHGKPRWGFIPLSASWKRNCTCNKIPLWTTSTATRAIYGDDTLNSTAVQCDNDTVLSDSVVMRVVDTKGTKMQKNKTPLLYNPIYLQHCSNTIRHSSWFRALRVSSFVDGTVPVQIDILCEAGWGSFADLTPPGWVRNPLLFWRLKAVGGGSWI